MKLPETIRLVVIDDDPTGIGTVHSCLLITDWKEEYIRKAFNHEQPFFYILTNTRALTRQEAEKRTREAVEAVLEVNKDFGYKLIFISRSDSCLRGHFPLESDVMKEVCEEHGIKVWPKQGFCPAFIESGRYTIDGVHYMKDGDKLVPIAETEFAHDNVFAYHTSVLKDYIKEKGANPDDYDIVDAQTYEELYAYTYKLLEETKDFDGAIVIRCSSSLPKAMSGIPDKPLLEKEDFGGSKLNDPSSKVFPGCFVVGSHVQKTTRQLNQLLEAHGTVGIELPIDRILDDAESLMSETLAEMKTIADRGDTPVVFTARKEVRIDDPDKRQHLGQTVSDFLVDIVRRLPYTPSYLVAKGGITSHDILTTGLNVKVATVMGQAINSVPCIMTEKFPYIIFPGNVGNDNSLREIYEKFA